MSLLTCLTDISSCLDACFCLILFSIRLSITVILSASLALIVKYPFIGSSLIGYFDNQLSLNLKTGHFYIVQRGHYHFFSTGMVNFIDFSFSFNDNQAWG